MGRKVWVVERSKAGGPWYAHRTAADLTQDEALGLVANGERVERDFVRHYGGKPDRLRVTAYVPATKARRGRG